MYIGAMTRHRELLESEELAAAFPIFRDAEKVIADPVVRNRGTIGGSTVSSRSVRGPVSGVFDAGRRVCHPQQQRRTGRVNARLPRGSLRDSGGRCRDS